MEARLCEARRRGGERKGRIPFGGGAGRHVPKREHGGGAGWRRGILRGTTFDGTFAGRNPRRNSRSEDTVVRGRKDRGTDFRRTHRSESDIGPLRLKTSGFRFRSPSRTWGSFWSFSGFSCRILFGIRSSPPFVGSDSIEPFDFVVSVPVDFHSWFRFGCGSFDPSEKIPKVASVTDPWVRKDAIFPDGSETP